MKGMLFTELIDFIERHCDMTTAEQIIDNAELESQGAYTSVGNYSHEEMISLVVSAATILDAPPGALMRQFGQELFSRLYESHPQFFEEGVNDAPLFLARIQQHIHDEVTKLYQDSKPPQVLVSKEPGLNAFPKAPVGLRIRNRFKIWLLRHNWQQNQFSSSWLTASSKFVTVRSFATLVAWLLTA